MQQKLQKYSMNIMYFSCHMVECINNIIHSSYSYQEHTVVIHISQRGIGILFITTHSYRIGRPDRTWTFSAY